MTNKKCRMKNGVHWVRFEQRTRSKYTIIVTYQSLCIECTRDDARKDRCRTETREFIGHRDEIICKRVFFKQEILSFVLRAFLETRCCAAGECAPHVCVNVLKGCEGSAITTSGFGIANAHQLKVATSDIIAKVV